MLEQVQKDSMTGFFVRDALIPLMEKLIRNVGLYEKKFSVALFDLDDFKKVNDRYGHLFGNQVLKDVSSALRSTLRDEGYAFRYGGDEFVVVFLNKTSEEVVKMAQKCREAIANYTFTFKGKTSKFTISCGISHFPEDGQNVDELIKKADEAAYLSKRFGGNLITKASKIRFIRLRNRLLLSSIALSILAIIYLLNQYVFEGFIPSFLKQAKTIKVVRKMDTIILKNGSIIRGHIINEIGNKVVVSLGMEEGESEFVLDKSEISEIIYETPK